MPHDGLIPGDTPPAAPALATRGPHAVGVRTLRWRVDDALDVEATMAAGEPRRGPRELVVEAWYPSDGDDEALCSYRDHLGRGLEDPERPPLPFERPGRASRDAPAAVQGAPLVIVSHGYPGSRYLLSWLGEHLASKGYAVLAADHTGSTHADMTPVIGSLYHRPLDIAALLDAADRWGAGHPELAGVWDARRVALAGYSLGGYGALVALGAGLSERAFEEPYLLEHPLHGAILDPLRSGDPFHEALVERVRPRVAAALLLAPWGGGRVWEERELARVSTPLLLAAGSHDDVSGYEDGVRRIWREARHADRDLLTFELARHNVGPVPPPPVAAQSGREDDWWHYGEPLWDPWRVLGVLQHVSTAYLGSRLRGEPLDHVLEGAARATAAREPRGLGAVQPALADDDERLQWPGFPPRASLGLRYERLAAVAPPTPEPPEEAPLHDLSAAALVAVRGWWLAGRARAAQARASV